jgi:hypothetical protein
MTVLKNVLGAFLAAGVLLTSTAALADGKGHGHDGPKGGDKPAAAPELAGKGAAAALALIAGGAAIVVSRRRRQS